MNSTDLATLGLVTVTFAIPLLAPLADDIRRRRRIRRSAPKRAIASRQSRSQAHPMTDNGRS